MVPTTAVVDLVIRVRKNKIILINAEILNIPINDN